jgi:acetyltransferase-like isoleucine patch superfamily enzyme
MAYTICENVKMGPGSRIQDYVIIGQHPCGSPDEMETLIGEGAIIRSHTVIYSGNRIGGGFQTGHGVLIRECNDIGDHVSIGSGSEIAHHVTIGNGVRIHSRAFVPEFTTLEDGCWIGPSVIFTNDPHPLCPSSSECMKGATVRRGAKIGANVTVLPNLTIGENALVGAGSVIVSDVPEGAVMAGNPAVIIKWIDELACPFGIVERPYIQGVRR